ncbi:hypothetical protein N7448_000948 [Penicillium atrosanguineum]|nr:hypothetical protein N7448_000948 [Penicillium atrosanguineum]
MRLHENDTRDPSTTLENGQPHRGQSQAPAPINSVTGAPALRQSNPLGQPTFSEPPNFFESDNLLEWLMSDINGASIVPLPLIDFPGSSNTTDNLHFPVSADMEAQVAQPTQGPGNMALDQIYKLIDDLSRKLNSDVHHSGFTSAFLDASLHEFFKRVSPSFPVIHEQTFSLQRSIPPLLLNMVALGSLFVCESGAVEKGEMLWRLGHTAVATSWQTLIEIRGLWDACDGVQLVLTALLGQTYALLSSNVNIRTTASVFHGLGFYWARTSGMFSVRDVVSEGMPSIESPDAEKNAVWRSWAAAEVQRRAILGHYVLDGLISQASGSPASARHLINSLETTCSETVFAAETADEWISEMMRSTSVRIPVSEAFSRVFSSGYTTMPLQLSQFSIFVIIEGLQSLISDLHEVRGVVFGTVSQQQVIRALLNIYEGNIASLSPSPNIHHLQILIRWHCVLIEMTAPSISIYRWLCNRYQLPQMLGGIHAKGSADHLDLTHWTRRADCYRAVLHAIAITRLLNDLPLSQAYTMHIPTAVFTSAMVMAIICLLSQSMIRIPAKYNWLDVWSRQLIENEVEEFPLQSPSMEDLFKELTCDGTDTIVSINLLDEINSLQIILRTVASKWGISAQMEDIIGRLATLARESHDPPT